jgi:hypothetical protein
MIITLLMMESTIKIYDRLTVSLISSSENKLLSQEIESEVGGK